MCLSISNAWDETKTTFARDGRLITTVAIALIGLPSALAELASPSSADNPAGQSPGTALIALLVGLVGLVGQLAIIRLAAGPSISVGEAIRHGASRALPYILAALLIMLAFILLAIPFIAVLIALGADMEPPIETIPPSAWLVLLLLFVLALYLAVRLLLSGPVASLEKLGPIAIIRRTWSLTAGHAPRLFGFLMLFALAAIILLGAAGLVARMIAEALFGAPEPFSASALIIALVAGLLSALATALMVVMLTRFYLQLSGGQADAEVSVPSTSEG